MPALSDHGLQARLRGKRVLVCVGAGGVGKTTTSAALALGLAMRGQKVAVVTIDPAKRLASALGLEELSGEPRRVEAGREAGVKIEGELWAMMLDVKRTFDDIVARLASTEQARDEILANPVYRELSTAVAGSQELSAVAKLYELYEEHDFDVIVLDTPPSRNALDFLNAPNRLIGFLDGRALQVFLAPGGLTARLFGRGTALIFSIFARVTGVDMLSELSSFFRSLGSVIDGFGERTRAVSALLRSPEAAFLIVTSPEAEPSREAGYLAERLVEAGMARAELVVNRVHSDGLDGQSEEAVEELLVEQLGASLGARVSSNLADYDVLARRDEATIERLSRTLGGHDAIVVPHLDEDVQDLLGLAGIAEYLFG
ncbi:MAG: ArsA family ATPase [Solirubrobacterales bacterium]|nr:ArsA family ATPase [Solirubrobacterales bacterium]